MRNDCQAEKYSHHKKFEKTERAIDGDEGDVVLCSLTKEDTKENAKKKVCLQKMLNSPQRLV